MIDTIIFDLDGVLIDSKKIDTDDELSFEISVDTSFFQEENDSYEEEE